MDGRRRHWHLVNAADSWLGVPTEVWSAIIGGLVAGSFVMAALWFTFRHERRLARLRRLEDALWAAQAAAAAIATFEVLKDLKSERMQDRLATAAATAHQARAHAQTDNPALAMVIGGFIQAIPTVAFPTKGGSTSDVVHVLLALINAINDWTVDRKRFEKLKPPFEYFVDQARQQTAT